MNTFDYDNDAWKVTVPNIFNPKKDKTVKFPSLDQNDKEDNKETEVNNG